MSEYRVYKTGESEPVRVSGAAAPEPLAAPGRSHRAARPEPAARGAGLRILVIWAAIAVAAAVAAALFWFYGRDMLGNSRAAFALARLSGKVPGWAMVGAPVIAVAIVAAVTAYLAFGRRLAVKLIGVAVVVAALAAPGLALGWANGTVSVVGHRSAEQETVVTDTEKELRPALPGKAMNILLIGSDKSKIPGDPGRSDTQILVRLDPETKSISMFSVPRDLRVLIPDHGYDKMNTAYEYGRAPLAVKTFSELTGLPINHFVEVNFAGFWHVVNILGGVYIPIDHRYYVPESADYKSIDIFPATSSSAVTTRSTSCATVTTSSATSRAWSVSSSSSRSCSASRTAGAGTGPRSSASSRPSPRRRPPTSTRSSACNRSSSSSSR